MGHATVHDHPRALDHCRFSPTWPCPRAANIPSALTALLWGNLDAEGPTGASGRALFVLKTALARARVRALRTEDDAVRLDPVLVNVDVATFERLVAEKVGNQVTLTSRNGLDHTKRFPELVKAVEGLDASSLVLDGEIAIFDRQLISRFEWLRARPKHELATPPMYMFFDLLELGGDDIRTRPLHERRQALEQLAADCQLVTPTRRLPANGMHATVRTLAACCASVM